MSETEIVVIESSPEPVMRENVENFAKEIYLRIVTSQPFDVRSGSPAVIESQIAHGLKQYARMLAYVYYDLWDHQKRAPK